MSVVCGDGKESFAHQSILTAGSPYFREALRDNAEKHPIVFLPREIGGLELTALIKFIYTGQACVSQEKLQAFCYGARYLRIKGLEDMDAAVVSCGNGPQHVSGLAQSESSWPPREASCGDLTWARGTVKKVLGNTYAVDCGKSPQQVSGDAQSKSSLCPEDIVGGQQFTEDHDQESSQIKQNLTQVGQVK